MEACVVLLSVSLLTRDDTSTLKNYLTETSSIVRKNDCVACLRTILKFGQSFQNVKKYILNRLKITRTLC